MTAVFDFLGDYGEEEEEEDEDDDVEVVGGETPSSNAGWVPNSSTVSLKNLLILGGTTHVAIKLNFAVGRSFGENKILEILSENKLGTLSLCPLEKRSQLCGNCVG